MGRNRSAGGPTRVLERLPGKVVKWWSCKNQREEYGYDFTVHGKRVSARGGFLTYEDALDAVEKMKLGARLAKAGLTEIAPEVLSGPVSWEAMQPGVCKPGVVGSICELLVCADLLKKGYDVYRSVSLNGACDLLVLKGALVCRVEVKSAARRKNGYNFRLEGYQEEAHDVLALVLLRESKIVYLPEVESVFAE